MTVLIAGGGIAGLTTALSLHQIGVDCRVFESVDAIQPLGVGINLLPHAVRELTELGLADHLAASAIPTAELAYYSARGQRIWSEPRGLAAGYRWPQFSIHRGALQMMLHAAACRRLGADRILTGHHLAHWEATPAGIRAHFVDRRTGASLGSADGSLLIAADGIHSSARQALYPREGPPIWNGAILWRGVTRARPFLTGRSMIMAGHEFQKFVAYPISREAEHQGDAVDQLDRGTQIPPGPPVAARGLEPSRQSRGLPAALHRLAVRLAGCAGADRRRRGLLRIPHGGSRSAGALDVRARHIARRCSPRDVSDRVEWGLAGDPRRPCAGARDPGARGRPLKRSRRTRRNVVPPPRASCWPTGRTVRNR